jgi:hypothetical protein
MIKLLWKAICLLISNYIKYVKNIIKEKIRLWWHKNSFRIIDMDYIIYGNSYTETRVDKKSDGSFVTIEDIKRMD